ncbi:MAG: DUF2027 domain-containing protein [Bacteroidales bacterium]|nr:DUF2027 domain-containing protein [Bacteroidales bacterium]
MRFKVGDKVKFLNETGGGIVSKVVSSSLVYVATEDGFELPTATGDIIKIDPESKAERMFSEDFDVDISKITQTPEAAPSSLPAGKIKAGAIETPGYYLAFIPADQQWFITGDIEVRIINHSKSDILYNVLLEDEDQDYFGFDYGSVEAGSSVIIDNIDREALAGWTDGIVQILVHSGGEAFLPLHCNFHIKAGKFSSEGSYQDSGLLREKAIIYKLADLKANKLIPGKQHAVKVEEEPVEVKAHEHKKESLIGRHAVGPHAAVVDLHIGEIVDNIAGLSSHDMFLLQINFFKKTLDSALANNFRKVTYIHGIGNGVLKNAIIEKLREYEGLENKSASLADYGQGAIDVLLYYRDE